MSDHTLDALETEWNKKHELGDKEKEEEEQAKNKKLKKDDDDDYILLIRLIPLPHECPIGPHDCCEVYDDDDDDEGRRCCHTEDHTCQCNNIDHGFEWYEVRRSEIGKAGGPFESCHSVDDVRNLFHTKGIAFSREYLSTTNPEFLIPPEQASLGYHIVFI